MTAITTQPTAYYYFIQAFRGMNNFPMLVKVDHLRLLREHIEKVRRWSRLLLYTE